MRYWIDTLDGDKDLEGVLEVEAESFTNPWTREMYAWELQNRSVCHIFVVRTSECDVAGFCAFWLVFDEIHINNLAMRPRFRGCGFGTAAPAPHPGRSARARGAPGDVGGTRVERRGSTAVRAARVLRGRNAAQLLLKSRGRCAHLVAG
jgi:hypothetical protein